MWMSAIWTTASLKAGTSRNHDLDVVQAAGMDAARAAALPSESDSETG